MATDKYLDPDNAPEILDKIKSLPTLGEIKKLVDETFPTWLVTMMKEYCPDYPHLQKNWDKICQMIGTRPTQIIIVDDFNSDDNHMVIKTFAECFTRSGFSVRKKYEYIPCENCSRAVPTQELWNFFSQKNIQIPEKWSPKCIGC